MDTTQYKIAIILLILLNVYVITTPTAIILAYKNKISMKTADWIHFTQLVIMLPLAILLLFYILDIF